MTSSMYDCEELQLVLNKCQLNRYYTYLLEKGFNNWESLQLLDASDAAQLPTIPYGHLKLIIQTIQAHKEQESSSIDDRIIRPRYKQFMKSLNRVPTPEKLFTHIDAHIADYHAIKEKYLTHWQTQQQYLQTIAQKLNTKKHSGQEMPVTMDEIKHFLVTVQKLNGNLQQLMKNFLDVNYVHTHTIPNVNMVANKSSSSSSSSNMNMNMNMNMKKMKNIKPSNAKKLCMKQKTSKHLRIGSGGDRSRNNSYNINISDTISTVSSTYSSYESVATPATTPTTTANTNNAKKRKKKKPKWSLREESSLIQDVNLYVSSILQVTGMNSNDMTADDWTTICIQHNENFWENDPFPGRKWKNCKKRYFLAMTMVAEQDIAPPATEVVVVVHQRKKVARGSKKHVSVGIEGQDSSSDVDIDIMQLQQ